MGQDKQQLAKLLQFVKAVYDDPENKDFSQGIQTIVFQDIRSEKKNGWSSKIDEIYEYCLNKNLREQANGLYGDFPLQSIVPSLVEDYIKMEEARRKNDFNEFGLHLYQQVENIVNTITQDKIFNDVYDRMKAVPSKVIYDKIRESYMRDEKSKSIAFFALIDSKNNPISKKMDLKASNMFAADKIRIVIYFICFKGEMQNKYYDDWNKYTSLFSDIYSIRNCVHKGGILNDYEKKQCDKIHSEASQYYLRFMSALLFLIEGVQSGYPLSNELIELAESYTI